jgi:hypothetical protein
LGEPRPSDAALCRHYRSKQAVGLALLATRHDDHVARHDSVFEELPGSTREITKRVPAHQGDFWGTLARPRPRH